MPISIPKFFQKAFAQNGGRQDVPVTGDTSGGRASYDEGFPPITRTNIVAGGIPPFGTDFNGVLYDITSAIQYIQAGRSFPYNQDFADAIGGYGKGSLVSLVSDLSVVYKSKVDNNLTPPPSANWEVSGEVAQATETVAGIAKVATKTKVSQGLDDLDFVTSKKLKDAGVWPILLNQSPTDVTSDRSIGVSYTNTTGRTIFATIQIAAGPVDVSIVSITIDGIVYKNISQSAGASAGSHAIVSQPIKNGGVYSYNWNGTSGLKIMEIR